MFWIPLLAAARFDWSLRSQRLDTQSWLFIVNVRCRWRDRLATLLPPTLTEQLLLRKLEDPPRANPPKNSNSLQGQNVFKGKIQFRTGQIVAVTPKVELITASRFVQMIRHFEVKERRRYSGGFLAWLTVVVSRIMLQNVWFLGLRTWYKMEIQTKRKVKVLFNK